MSNADQARSGVQNLWDAPDFSGTHILPFKKKKKTLDLQVFSRKGKAMKKLQWIPDTIINTNVLEYFDNNYICGALRDLVAFVQF